MDIFALSEPSGSPAAVPLNAKQELRLRTVLRPAELLVWADRPGGRHAGKSVLWSGLFGLIWSVAALRFLFASADTSLVAGIVQYGFAVVGLVILGITYLMWRNIRSNIYAITNERVILISGAGEAGIESHESAHVVLYERKLHADGSGDLVLRIEEFRDDEGQRGFARHGFLGIANLQAVEQLLQPLLKPGALAPVFTKASPLKL